MDLASYSQGTPFQVDGLIASGSYTTRKVTILSGQVLDRGSMLGSITATGKCILSLAAAVDGSEEPDFALAHDVDASGGDVEAIVIETGNLVSSALTIGTGHTIASIREGLRVKGITIDD